MAKRRSAEVNTTSIKSVTGPVHTGSGDIIYNSNAASENSLSAPLVNAPLYGDHTQTGERSRTKPLAKAVAAGVPHPPAHVFVSYSRADAKWLCRLRVHLEPLVMDGLLEVWDDTKIPPGADWRREIEIALARSRIAILLVSADFLASDFITKAELPVLLSLAAARGLHVIPVIVGPSLVSECSDIATYTAVNPPGRPLSGMTQHESEEVLSMLARAVAAIVGQDAPSGLSTE